MLLTLPMPDGRFSYASESTRSSFFPLIPEYAKAMLNLSVSDMNKELLLACADFIPTMVDSLLLDPEHPRRAQPDFDAVAPPAQQEALPA